MVNSCTELDPDESARTRHIAGKGGELRGSGTVSSVEGRQGSDLLAGSGKTWCNRVWTLVHPQGSVQRGSLEMGKQDWQQPKQKPEAGKARP